MNLKNIHNVYFVGIGGIGMSSLARYFNHIGKRVAGFDRVSTPLTVALEALDISIHYEDNVDLVPQVFKNNTQTLVVYTPAIPNNHIELNYFIDQGFEVLKRSEVLGAITKDTLCLAVAGTHGKTTTSTILGHILKEANAPATSFLGGIAENYNSNLILGGGDVSVVEADEFDRSFLKLSPNIACVTSMDADHLDIYGEKEALEDSFKDFSALVENTLVVKKGLSLKGLTYALNEKADYYADNLRIEEGSYVFDIKTPKEIITDVVFGLPGKHNISNAVAATAIANLYGVSLIEISKALATFKGVQRRFSYKIKRPDLVLIDDYAHHPTEINAVVDSVRELYPNQKIVAIFQPHLFSRTRDFIDDFATSLSKFDALILLDIYPARELPIEGITSSWLLDKVTLKEKMISSKEMLIDNIKETNATVYIMIGAGDIGELVVDVQKALE